MRSRHTTYLIAEVLYCKYGSGVEILEKQIEEEISMIAGDDPRTLNKYKKRLEKDGYVVLTSPPPNTAWRIIKKPERPLKPSEYRNYIKSLKQ